MKAKFHDRHEQHDDLKVVELTRQLLADPATGFVRDHMASNPHQAAYAAMWLELLSRSVGEIADRLLDDARGRLAAANAATVRARLPVL